MSVTAHATGPASPASNLRDRLDEVGPLEGERFHPGRALTAMKGLMAMPEAERMPFLLHYARTRMEVPTGVFAVVRALIELPPEGQAEAPFPAVLQPGHLRPPALGAPTPSQPTDLTERPRWPLVLIDDVPLVLVAGYRLGGKPESLAMHVEALEAASWRSTPLKPASASQIAGTLSGWSEEPAVRKMLEGQVARYEAEPGH